MSYISLTFKRIIVNKVIVVDDNNKVISKTNSALARKLLNRKEAEVVSKDPFVVKLLKPIVYSLKEEETQMEARNINELIKNEEPIYIQNVTGNGQVSMGLRTLWGDYKRLRVENTTIPVCITDEFTYEEIKNFSDLRRCIAKKWLRVMNVDDYNDYLKRKAATKGKKIFTEAQKAQERMTAQAPEVDKMTAEHEEALRRARLDADLVDITSIINPRILGICQRLGKDSDNPLDPFDALDNFEALSPLSDDELNYIMGHCGGNKTIQKWIAQKQSEMIAQDSDDEEVLNDNIDNQNPLIEVQKTTIKKGRPKTKK